MRITGLADTDVMKRCSSARAHLAVLPPDRYPCLVAGATAMTAHDPDLHYRFGIDLFIGGVQAMAARTT